MRERATTAREFDPAEIRARPAQPRRSRRSCSRVLPLVVVVVVNLLMSLVVLPRLDVVVPRRGALGRDLAVARSAASGRWWSRSPPRSSTLIALNYRRLPALRATMDAGANASVLPVVSVASLVGFGAVVAALPAFEMVRDWVLAIDGGPLVSLAVATNVLAALTGSASGGLTIALDALGATYMQLAAETGHRSRAAASRRGDRLPARSTACRTTARS